MGAVTIKSAPDADFEDESDALSPIGAVDVASNATIMTLRRDPAADGQYVFAAEVPATFGAFRRVLETRDSKRFAWLRLEAKLAPATGGIGDGDCLICAEDPYSAFWVGSAFFKGPNRKGPTRLDGADIKNLDEAARWVAQERTDYWETGSALTAAVMHDAFGAVHRDAAQTARKSARYVLGACPKAPGAASPLDAAVQTLWESGSVRTLLRATERGTITFTYNRQEVPLKPRVRDDRNSIMFLAIQQALAGPSTQSQTFIGQPVVGLVGRIYRDHLNNLNRQDVPDADGGAAPLDRLELGSWARRQAQEFHSLDRSDAGDEG